jgi:hypothetical protein
VKDKLKTLEPASMAATLSKGKNAEACYANGEVKEAIETEKKTIDLQPDDKEFRENLALYERENRKQ